jgi:hypothetical protein
LQLNPYDPNPDNWEEFGLDDPRIAHLPPDRRYLAIEFIIFNLKIAYLPIETKEEKSFYRELLVSEKPLYNGKNV